MRLVRFTGPGGHPIFVNPESVAAVYQDPMISGSNLTIIRLVSDFTVLVLEEVTPVGDALCHSPKVQREPWTQTIRLGDMNK